MDPALIIFAIEAAVRLGRKLNEVLIDETHEHPLVLPLGKLHANVREVDAVEFFDRAENVALVEDGGPYSGFDHEQLLKAHATLIVLDERLGGRGDTLSEATDTVEKLHRFEQLKEGLGANPPVQRVVGTIVEIGIDYFAANPEALGKESSGRKVLLAFVTRLDDVEFAEGSREQLVGQVLLAALHVLGENVSLVDDDKRLQVLLGGVTKAVIGEVEQATTEAEKIRREDLFERIGRGILRGGVTAFTENTDLFLPGDSAAKPIVESALRQTLAGLRDHDDLFTSESVEVIFSSALRAVGENSQLFSDQKILQELIVSTTNVLASQDVAEILSRETASAVLAVGLEVTAENVETLIDTGKPQKQLLASMVSALAQGLSDDLAGGAQFRDLLSRRQLVELSSIVFQEVASQPEQLLGDDLSEARRNALAQVIGSVAAALGDDPKKLVNGEGVLELVQIAMHVGVRNADKLLDLDTEDPKTNLLYRITQELVLGALEAEDPRGLLSREVFLEMVARALPVASAHVGPLLSDQQQIVKETVAKAFELSTNVLENRTNGENLPILVEGLLAKVLRGELKLDQQDDVVAKATKILNAA
jgi:hypothetical protein